MKSKAKANKRISPKKKVEDKGDEEINLDEDISFDEGDSESDYESSQKKRKSNQRENKDNSSGSEESTPAKKIKVNKKAKDSTIEQYMNSTLDLSRDLLTPIKSSQLATQWISLFRTDPVEAFHNWINVVLKSVGFKNMPDFEGIDTVEAINIEYILEGVLQQSPDEKSIWFKPKTNEKKFRNKYERFLRDLIIKSKDTILTEITFLPEWTKILIAISSSCYKQLRHIGTISSLVLGESLLVIIENYKSDIEQFEMNNITSSSSSSSSKRKGNNKMKEININNIENNVMYLSEIVNTIFNNIFVHRFKDINEVIREDTLRYFGKWLFTRPSVYIKDDYTKYYGWCLNDIKPKVRSTAVNVLTQIYNNESTLNEMSDFTSRFINRIYNMLNDKDENVICNVLELLEILYKNSYLDSEKIDKIYELLFVENNKIQNGAITFLINEMNDINIDSDDNSDNNERILIKIMDIMEKIIIKDNNNSNIEERIMNFTNSLLNYNNNEILNFNILYNLLIEPKQPISNEYQYYISLILYSYWSILDKMNNNEDNLKRNINKVKIDREYNEMKKGLKNRIPELIRSFEHDNKICEILIRLYNTCDLENIICDISKNELNIMLQIFKDIYNIKMEDKILMECSKCFYSLEISSSDCKELVKKIINEIYTSCSKEIVKNNNNNKVNRDICLKRLCYLIEYNDIKVVDMELIKKLYKYVNSIKNEDNKMCIYCCISIIINQLLHIVMNGMENIETIDNNLINEFFTIIDEVLIIYCKNYNDESLYDIYDYKLFEIYCNLKSLCSRNTSVLIRNDLFHYKSKNDEIENHMNKYINEMILNNKNENEISKIGELMKCYFYVGFNNGSSKEICLILEKMTKRKEYENYYKEILNILKENRLYYYYDIIFKTIEYMYKTKCNETSINEIINKYLRLIGVGYIKNKSKLFIKALMNGIENSIKDNSIEILKYYGKFVCKISDLERKCLYNELKLKYDEILKANDLKYKYLDYFVRVLSNNEMNNVNDDDNIENGNEREEEDNDEDDEEDE